MYRDMAYTRRATVLFSDAHVYTVYLVIRISTKPTSHDPALTSMKKSKEYKVYEN
jgi:hypothetical protein